jgi:hypothetical protein
MNTKIRSRLAWLGTGYSTALAFLYVLSHWGALGINALEFTHASDVMGLALTPALGTLAAFGYQATHGNAEHFVDVRRSGLKLTADEQHPVAYLGHLGDHFVLYESVVRSLVLIADGALRNRHRSRA